MVSRAAIGILLAAAVPAACGSRAKTGIPDVVPSSDVFQATIEEVLPAVVLIQVEMGPTDGPDFVELMPPGGRGAVPPSQIPRFGAGSGVLFTDDGYILTSSHVVQDADRVKVTLYDRRQFDAKVVALDPSTDVAVVKIESVGLPTASLGDSDAVDVGEWVLALGSPLGLLFTATAGIISAKGRAIGILERPDAGPGVAPLESFLQTDAAINPGNSGGPLVDLAGEVVGITTAIASTTGTFAGAGFAIPINLARRVAADLIQYGFVRRPVLGVILGEVDPVDIEVYKLPGPGGAEVVHVQEGSPAARAGLALGDVIIGIGDQKITSPAQLRTILAELEPGAQVELRIIRYGKEYIVPVALGGVRAGERPARPRAEADSVSLLGFAVTGDGDRVVVAAVRPFSPAARAGVRPGQVIVAVNRKPVGSLEEFASVVETIKQGIVSLIVIDPTIGRTIINYRLRP